MTILPGWWDEVDCIQATGVFFHFWCFHVCGRKGLIADAVNARAKTWRKFLGVDQANQINNKGNLFFPLFKPRICGDRHEHAAYHF